MATNPLKKTISTLFILIFFSGNSFALGSIFRPYVMPMIGDWMGTGYYVITTLGSFPNEFNIRIQGPISDVTNPSEKLDIYFGIMTPDGKTLTWVPDDATEEGAIIVEGLRPIAVNYKHKPDGYYLHQITKRRIKYMFTGSEPNGLYFIFAILMHHGKDPADMRAAWAGFGMTPMLVQRGIR